VIIQTNDEGTSSESTETESEQGSYEEPTAPTINQTTRRAKRRWRDAELLLPPNIFHKKLLKGRYASKISKEASVALTGVLEYLVSEVLEMAKECADANQKKRIQPRHIMLAIKRDVEFAELLKDVTIAGTGVVPFIQDVLLPKSTPSPTPAKRSLEQ
jgi:histone H2A